MNKLTRLQQLAINSAKKLDWESAVAHNLEYLEINPQDMGALNRLGVSYLQLGKTADAKNAFQEVLKIDKSNIIAQKHLGRIKSKRAGVIPSFSREQFIEEPGLTKMVELHRLASKDRLEQLSVGQICKITPKSRYLSVETESGVHVGALPEDLSFRLTRLIQRGNEYACFIHSTNPKSCTVYLKETKRSKKNEHVNSFPLSSKGSMTAINDVDERFIIENNIPVNIVKTDEDNEKRLDQIETDNED